ncbi:hypothetical protein WICPIJ_006683 [Wickerhamomyces pijperi]|uniref:Endonuclease III homolog n=1 Tax=Wickerhamomyces pijperi TaxID=599730 RepID=A0A9P8Q3S8_WICPI|nr:hypothetical protein WICPIJ_006683 [Wickerhamomyces pijperi]
MKTRELQITNYKLQMSSILNGSFNIVYDNNNLLIYPLIIMRRSARLIGNQAKGTGERSRFFKKLKQEEIQLEQPPIPTKRRQIQKIKIEVKEELEEEEEQIGIFPKVESTLDESKIPVKNEYQNVKIPINNSDVVDINVKTESLNVRPIMEREGINLNIPDYNSPVDLTKEELLSLPTNFIPIYTLIKKMRAKIIAPVDTMGCAEIPVTLDTEGTLSPINYRFQLLISLMLSSQTKDEINYKAMCQMKEHFQAQGFKDGICLEAIEAIDEKTLDSLIFSVGFHSRKAQYIKKTAQILRSEYQGDIPNTLDGLVGLPGVGPKMSYLTLQKAWNLNEGIGVDVHVDRLSKQFKWVNAKACKTPEITRAELQKWLPRSLWGEINPVLVGFGQSICLPKGRRCDLCALSRTNLCSNVDTALLRKVAKLGKDDLDRMNRTLRFQFVTDIEDLVSC